MNKAEEVLRDHVRYDRPIQQQWVTDALDEAREAGREDSRIIEDATDRAEQAYEEGRREGAGDVVGCYEESKRSIDYATGRRDAFRDAARACEQKLTVFQDDAMACDIDRMQAIENAAVEGAEACFQAVRALADQLPPKRPYPWDDPGGPYDSAGPKEMVDFEIDTIRLRRSAQLRVTPTKLTGINTARTRYKTECLTCVKVLHPATTGPESVCDQHLREVHA